MKTVKSAIPENGNIREHMRRIYRFGGLYRKAFQSEEAAYEGGMEVPLNIEDHDVHFFKSNLKYLHEGHRFTQSGVEVKTGLKQGRISNFMNDSRPFLDEAIIISEAVQESLDDLIYLDMADRDANWRGDETQRRVAAKQKEVSGDPEIVGRLPLGNERVLKRFDNRSYYVYYYSGVGKKELQEGELIVKAKRPNVNFLLGTMRTHSQVYGCKLIVEHPNYLYVYGNNIDNMERLVLMLHEPKVRYDSKPYLGGLGIVTFEGSSGFPTTQRMALSVVRLPDDDQLRDFLNLRIADGYRCEVRKKEDTRFYKYIRECGKNKD